MFEAGAIDSAIRLRSETGEELNNASVGQTRSLRRDELRLKYPTPSARQAATPDQMNRTRVLVPARECARVRTHYSDDMTVAAMAIAAMKILMLRSKQGGRSVPSP